MLTSLSIPHHTKHIGNGNRRATERTRPRNNPRLFRTTHFAAAKGIGTDPCSTQYDAIQSHYTDCMRVCQRRGILCSKIHVSARADLPSRSLPSAPVARAFPCTFACLRPLAPSASPRPSPVRIPASVPRLCFRPRVLRPQSPPGARGQFRGCKPCEKVLKSCHESNRLCAVCARSMDMGFSAKPARADVARALPSRPAQFLPRRGVRHARRQVRRRISRDVHLRQRFAFRGMDSDGQGARIRSHRSVARARAFVPFCDRSSLRTMVLVALRRALPP